MCVPETAPSRREWALRTQVGSAGRIQQWCSWVCRRGAAPAPARFARGAVRFWIRFFGQSSLIAHFVLVHGCFTCASMYGGPKKRDAAFRSFRTAFLWFLCENSSQLRTKSCTVLQYQRRVWVDDLVIMLWEGALSWMLGTIVRP